MDLLKSSKEELNNSLKATTQVLEELKKTKVCSLFFASWFRMVYTGGSDFNGIALNVFIFILWKFLVVKNDVIHQFPAELS